MSRNDLLSAACLASRLKKNNKLSFCGIPEGKSPTEFPGLPPGAPARDCVNLRSSKKGPKISSQICYIWNHTVWKKKLFRHLRIADIHGTKIAKKQTPPSCDPLNPCGISGVLVWPFVGLTPLSAGIFFLPNCRVFDTLASKQFFEKKKSSIAKGTPLNLNLTKGTNNIMYLESYSFPMKQVFKLKEIHKRLFSSKET